MVGFAGWVCPCNIRSVLERSREDVEDKKVSATRSVTASLVLCHAGASGLA